MKKGILLIAFVSMISLAFKPAAVEYKVDTQKSKIEWIGKKVTGEHRGEIKLASGVLNYNGSALNGGNFVINMNSMTVTDLQGEMNGKLLGHLKADDFFGVDKFAQSKFVITKVTAAGAGKVNISGNLTIKGITQPLTFPAAITVKNGVLVAVANGVKVDRTKYDIKYGSKSFFDSLGDKAINDEFELNINLVAKK
ncbi:YceI family protein [Pedobacter aquae]|jgi:polyisoprenoid-binding protein YceI|uniref:YceI family protein n=1 Tax=Pedobacter aquae TaxID=2605747 RepID=A0A5C0VIN8_9SPHI|nr:YceI family protein [Pedobacter aquae]QEK51957.1 YceI family protein [Pedobacter aquae]